MLLKGCCGCVVLPVWFAGGVFVFGAWEFGGPAPTAGEARVLALALAVPPAAMPVAGIDEGIMGKMARGWVVGLGRRSWGLGLRPGSGVVRCSNVAVLHRRTSQMQDTIASQCVLFQWLFVI